jgi:hypothetical protein
LRSTTDNNLLFAFTDSTFINYKNEKIIKRFINHFNHEYYYYNNEEILSITRKKTKIFSAIDKEKVLKFKAITLDLETMTINGNLIPFAGSVYDGDKSYSVYLSDFKSHEDMLVNLIKYLLKPKYSGYNIYVHNLSQFDGVFLMNILENFDSKCKAENVYKTKLTPLYDHKTGNMTDLSSSGLLLCKAQAIVRRKTVVYKLNTFNIPPVCALQSNSPKEDRLLCTMCQRQDI